MADYGHAKSILEKLNASTENKQEKVDKIINQVAYYLSIYIYQKNAVNSDIYGVMTDGEKQSSLDYLEREYGGSSLDDGIAKITEGLEKAGLQPIYSKWLLQKDTMKNIAGTIVHDYKQALKKGESLTYPQIAGCMSAIEKELGITCKEVMGKNIIGFLEDELAKDPSTPKKPSIPLS